MNGKCVLDGKRREERGERREERGERRNGDLHDPDVAVRLRRMICEFQFARSSRAVDHCLHV